jgi:hypothetical protein
MGSVIAIFARKGARPVAIAAVAVAGLTLGAVTPAQAAQQRLSMGVAATAAHEVVLADSSYRIIATTEPLRTRHCWRAPGKVVRCSLYRLAPNPCALDGGPPPDALCAQVLARRTWLVEVGPAGSPLPAKIRRIVDAPA